MHHISVSWHTIPLKFSWWNIICFSQKERINVKFSDFKWSNKSSVNFSGFAQILHHCSVSWKITRLYFFTSNLILFDCCSYFKHDKTLVNFHPSTQKSLIGFFCVKYITFDLKNNRGVIFQDTEESWKIWRKINLQFGKWHKKFGKFSPEHLKVSKLILSWDPFVQSRKCLT